MGSSLDRIEQSSALLRLLNAHAALDDTHVRAIRDLLGGTAHCGPQESPLHAFDTSPLLIASGWAGAAGTLEDGRRQFVSLLLPGDFIRPSFCSGNGLAAVALTRLTVVNADELVRFLDTALTMPFQPLAKSWSGVRRDFEKGLVRQALRLGRMTAYERTADLLLELFDRQRAVGMAEGLSISMPLTQEILADHLGLSVVHMNRTMQQLRREGLIVSHEGRVSFPDPERLARAVPKPS